ncbi:MAG: Divergent family protein [Firmicutes bacterium]|nr:Divergent family protein [Bacillota bacterium]
MNSFLTAIVDNKILMVSMIAWALAQLLKMLVYYCILKEFSIERMFGAGGMPSSHSALVVSLSTAIGMVEGVESTNFAIAVVLAGVVMYDATGVRQAAGKHAKAINRIVKQLSSKNTFDDISLKELLGHTPIEVIVGALLGFFVAYIFTK